jgi:hypothetical protein
VRPSCALSLASRGISTSRHSSVRRSGASATRRHCAGRPVREARRVARRKRARPDRTPCSTKLGSLWPVARGSPAYGVNTGSCSAYGISTSRHSSVRRSGACGTRWRCARRPVGEAR